MRVCVYVHVCACVGVISEGGGQEAGGGRAEESVILREVRPRVSLCQPGRVLLGDWQLRLIPSPPASPFPAQVAESGSPGPGLGV